MNSTVWKFAAPVTPGAHDMHMPQGAEILVAQLQDGRPQLWAVVDPDAPIERRVVFAAMTGQTITTPHGWKPRHFGTALLDGGLYVLHYFEVVQQ